MSHNNRILHFEPIMKFLLAIGMGLFLTRPQLGHTCRMMAGFTQKGFRGKVSDLNDLVIESSDRSCATKFLGTSTWNEMFVLGCYQRFAVDVIWELSRKSGLPIEVVIDDTISEKTKPSSKAKAPIQLCQFHQSHLENAKVYGHQLVVVLLQCGDVRMPYVMAPYNKSEHSKIEMAVTAVQGLPKPPHHGYVLADSWYSSKKLMQASLDAGYQYIGGLKTNRIFYPETGEHGYQLKKYSKLIKCSDCDLVTIGKSSYYVYRYQGKINGLDEDVIILLSWPQKAFGDAQTLRCFVATDVSMTTQDILERYKARWPIEVYIRQMKMLMGLKGYQVRKENSIRRFLLMLMLSYAYVCYQAPEQSYLFGRGLRLARRRIKEASYKWIYAQALNGVSFESAYTKAFGRTA